MAVCDMQLCRSIEAKFVCEGCQKRICYDCHRECIDCEQIKCCECIEDLCADCSEWICKKCIKKCDCCVTESYCSDYMHSGVCYECKSRVCKMCGSICSGSGCENVICIGCGHTCNSIIHADSDEVYCEDCCVNLSTDYLHDLYICEPCMDELSTE